MRSAYVRDDGSVVLGDEARAAGYRPGTALSVVVLSTGSLLVTVDDSVPLEAVPYRALAHAPGRGGAAQVARRRAIAKGDTMSRKLGNR